MLKIYKYAIEITDSPKVEMPVGAEVISVGVQNHGICIWAIVDPHTNSTELREFQLRGTGHPLDFPSSQMRFIGTVVLYSESLVFHLFESLRPPH